MTPVERLTKMLEARGYAVLSVTLPLGHYRSSPYADVVRWTASVRQAGGAPFHIASWDTVTACTRRGFDIGKREGCSGHIEAHALERPEEIEARESRRTEALEACASEGHVPSLRAEGRCSRCGADMDDVASENADSRQ